MRHDLLADAMSAIANGVKSSKKEVSIGFRSNLTMKILDIFKKEGFISDYSTDEATKGLRILLNGKLNKCNAIKPRFSVKKDEIEKYEKRYLPAKDFGCIIISTNKGLITHYEAKEKKLGGKLIAYVY